MRELMVILLLIGQIGICMGERVEMKDSQEFEGFLRGKLNGNLYIIDDKLYELPLEYVYRVYKGKHDTTREWIEAEDFQDFKFDDWRYPLERYEYRAEVEADGEDDNRAGGITREAIMEMSEREFELYRMEIQVKQRAALVNQVGGIRSTMWKIWGVSILGGIIGGILVANAGG